MLIAIKASCFLGVNAVGAERPRIFQGALPPERGGRPSHGHQGDLGGHNPSNVESKTDEIAFVQVKESDNNDANS